MTGGRKRSPAARRHERRGRTGVRVAIILIHIDPKDPAYVELETKEKHSRPLLALRVIHEAISCLAGACIIYNQLLPIIGM